jgi:hypothetical protein
VGRASVSANLSGQNNPNKKQPLEIVLEREGISFIAEPGAGLACGWRRSRSEASFDFAKRSQIYVLERRQAAASGFDLRRLTRNVNRPISIYICIYICHDVG